MLFENIHIPFKQANEKQKQQSKAIYTLEKSAAVAAAETWCWVFSSSLASNSTQALNVNCAKRMQREKEKKMEQLMTIGVL